MDQVKQFVKQFEDARAANKAEWETFSEDIKSKINGFNEKVAAHKLKGSEIEERAKGLSQKVDDYKRKHMEFEQAAKDKNMTNEEAVKKLQEEQERLLKRRGEVEVSVAK